MKIEIAERLAMLNISVMSEGQHFCLFVRDGCLAMVPRAPEPFGFQQIGSSGLSTEQGLLYLVYREDQPMLVGQGVEIPAEPEQVEKIVQFSKELKAALGLE